jgi:hypothetical protein
MNDSRSLSAADNDGEWNVALKCGGRWSGDGNTAGQ